MFESIDATRRVPRQVITRSVVNVVTVSEPTVVPVTVVQTQAFAPTQASDSSTSAVRDGMSVGWIVAVVALVALAISLTVHFLFWRSKRRNRKYGGSRSRRDVQSAYYDITRPPRAEQRRSHRFSNFGRR